MGLVWRVCEPDELFETTMRHARHLAKKPISSLVESKAAMIAPRRAEIEAARQRENAAFQKLMAGPANAEALRAFAEKRVPISRTCRRGGDAGVARATGPGGTCRAGRSTRSVRQCSDFWSFA